jgi:hypothetical protein
MSDLVYMGYPEISSCGKKTLFKNIYKEDGRFGIIKLA